MNLLPFLFLVTLSPCHPVALSPSHYEWRPWPGHAEAALMLDGRQVGSWNAVGGHYRPLNADGTWGEKTTASPISPPVSDFGVDADKVSASTRYTLSGKEVSRQEAERAIEDSRLPDHAGMLRVTVIGPREQTRSVLDDLAKSSLGDRIIAKAYVGSHWHVAQSGFATDGSPTIYVQAADGTVLHRLDDYAGGIEGLTSTLAKLRKPSPDYDKTKDPDTRRALAGRSVPVGLLCLGGAAAAALYLTRKRE